MVSSRLVADHFGRRHADVMRAIDNLLSECPKIFGERNFRVSHYQVAEQDRKYPFYEMTRDGFTLLAMGFTGPEAMAWKIRYIEAFNGMESKLLESLRDEKFQAKIQLYLSEEMRPWQKTFPDELWAEFARLTGREL